MKLTGIKAIEYAEANGLTLNKHADPIEDAREGVTPDEARKIAREDPSLIWIERELPETVLARWEAADWDDDKMIASKYTYETEDGPINLTEAQAAMYSWGTCEDNLTGGSQRGWLRA